MLTSLTIEGYRCFQHFELPELRRVNLLVGRNNSGKSTVLEAAGLLAGAGLPENLQWVIRDRQDQVLPEIREVNLDLEPLFCGWRFEPGGHFQIRGNRGDQPVSVTYALVGPRAVREVEVRRVGWEPAEARYPLDYRSLRLLAPDGFTLEVEPRPSHIGHIGVRREPLETVTRLWSELVGNPQEELVTQSLGIIEAGIERLIVTPQPDGPRVYVVLRGHSQRVPFYSLGEGSWRLLSVAMKMAYISRNGTLLIDEFDTGLHHTTQTRLWKMVLQIAAERDIQVFATTHSRDCLQALANLHAEDTVITQDFLLHYINRDEPRARTFTADEVGYALEHDLELRG